MCNFICGTLSYAELSLNWKVIWVYLGTFNSVEMFVNSVLK